MENHYRQMKLGIIDLDDLCFGGGTSNLNWFRSEHFLCWWQAGDPANSWAADFLEFFETGVLAIR